MSLIKAQSLRPVALQCVRLLGGPFKDRQDVNAAYLRSVDVDRLLEPFLREADLPHGEPYGGWESRSINGHSLGHYLSAVSHLAAGTDEDWPRQRVDHIVEALGRCQREDGALLPVPRKIYDDLKAGRIDASPFELNGCWVPNYTIHKVFAGLRDAYRLAGIRRALEIEVKFADWLAGVMDGLDEEQVQRMLAAEHGGMNEVLADLRADTGNPRYLQLAERGFNMNAVLDPLMAGEDRLDGQHGNTQIPKVVGLACEHELTGKDAYRRGVETFWHAVVANRSFAMGGHGESEHFFPPTQFPDKLTPMTAETCNTYNMLKLTGHYFAWQPSADKMDFVERAMINHLLANLGQAPGEFGYFLGLGSVGVKVFSKPNHAWWCCVGTGMENPTRYAEHAYYEDGDSLWVNLYMDSRVAWDVKGVTLRTQTAFPDGDEATLTIDADEPITFELKLRHPYWCERMQVSVNGEAIEAGSTSSSYLSIRRTWQSGDQVRVQLPMTLRAEPLPHSEGRIVALMYGPLVLAGVVPPNPDEPDPAKQRFGEHLEARGKTNAFPPVLVADSVEQVLTSLIPTGRAFAEFQSHGVVKPDDLRFIPLHRVYEEHYAVYFSLLSASQWAEREARLQAEHAQAEALRAATVDELTPGYQQPEIEHGLRSQRSEVFDFHGRKGRRASSGGFFSYELDVDPDEPMVLGVTYWGGEWHHHTFDLMIDGQPIAMQVLRTNKPGDFFEQIYPIPHKLTQDKSRVTLRFQPHEDSIAGGVFGVRVLRATAHEKMKDNPWNDRFITQI